MKVILTGAHGVGKTTLMKSLRKDYQDIIIPELVRDILAQYPEAKHSQKASLTEQEMFFDAYQRKLNTMHHYISDRGLVDVLAYTIQLGKHCTTPSDWREYNYVVEKQLKACREFDSNNRNVHYIYIPIEFDLQDDSFRDTDKHYQQSIDAEIVSLLKANNNDITIIRGDIKSRTDQFHQLIDWWWDNES